MSSTEITTEQIDGLRELAEALTGKKFTTTKDPAKLQAIIDIGRAEQEEKETAKTAGTGIGVTKAQKRLIARKEATRLVRVNITAMSPFEKQLKGAFFDVGNSVIGAVRRYVPFDVDWHVEEIIVEHLKNKKYRTKREYKDPVTRQTVYENLFHRAFGVVVLESLTSEELAEHTRAMKAREYGIQ